ncbi:hypothetical protein AAFN60_21300 [Roseibacillus persicicus]|uniref:hypothetical protein n=1 Tax=Roseibacillus persicicus TaxID=454148 RepID=UPI00398BAE35
MSFSDDNGGFAFSCDDGKICINASTWSTRLSQIGRFGARIRIVTHGLPDPDYIGGILAKRPKDIFIICNEDAAEEAKQLKTSFPGIRIATNSKSNAKLVLVAPETVWASSADFGYSKLENSTVGLHSKEVHDRIVAEVFEPMWGRSDEIEGPVTFWT